MEKIVEILRKRPGATYTLTDVERMGLFPWAKGGRMIRNTIMADLKRGNLLGATITGDASQRRYLLTARGIIRYLTAYGPALVVPAYKEKKQPHGRKKRGRGAGESKD